MILRVWRFFFSSSGDGGWWLAMHGVWVAFSLLVGLLLGLVRVR